MPLVHPTPGTYRLNPSSGAPGPYNVTVTPADKLQQPPLTDKEWSDTYQGFVIVTEGGVFGFRCYGGTYHHFMREGIVESTLDQGTCEEV